MNPHHDFGPNQYKVFHPFCDGQSCDRRPISNEPITKHHCVREMFHK
jgi:hypothetical protein